MDKAPLVAKAFLVLMSLENDYDGVSGTRIFIVQNSSSSNI
jgi:hypothetical protein